ncbi:MAG: SUMF1/EgtB/PvdO family nonheme iron enzyme [Verrucomicrobiota bacterium]
MALPSPIPDNPIKWDGWKFYNSNNPYERLCLSYSDNPSAHQIEDSCRQLLVWWQKKLPLKNQPSNPLAQMLRSGLDEAPRYLAEARMQLLNKDIRANIDARLRAELKEQALAEFDKFLNFILAGGVISTESEENLYSHGTGLGLETEEMKARLESELEKRGVKRQTAPIQGTTLPSGKSESVSPPRVAVGLASSNPSEEFVRMLRLTGLSEDEMTDDQRDALCNMGENLGLTGGQAEDLIDAYLDEVSGLPPLKPVGPVKNAAPKPATTAQNREAVQKAAVRQEGIDFARKITPLTKMQEQGRFPNFTNAAGMEMLLVPSGVFLMGSSGPGAPPNEQPEVRTMVSCFHMSRFPVTNEQYERFDPSHRSKRAPWADDNHPVIYVSSIEAIKFCMWLNTREKRKFRLPTEAEWEYAARGTEGRIFPWGDKLNRGDLANLADCNTNFPWRAEDINDGYAQTSPVSAYPRGASPFGIEDMSGNVWEWCQDYFEAYKGNERIDPRGPVSGTRRVYRGGSWKSRASSLRGSTRNFNMPDYSSNDVGFRVVCDCE